MANSLLDPTYWDDVKRNGQNALAGLLSIPKATGNALLDAYQTLTQPNKFDQVASDYIMNTPQRFRDNVNNAFPDPRLLNPYDESPAAQDARERLGNTMMGFAAPITKYEQAHQVAQKNAVEMLGLPADNTAMDRARAMGYTTPVYHGTSADFKAFDPLKRGKASDAGWYGDADYTSPNTTTADAYAMRDWPNYKDGGNVMPLMAKMENPYDYRKETGGARGLIQNNQGDSLALRKELQDKGHDSVVVNNSFIHLKDGESLTSAQWDALSNADPLVKMIGKEKIENSLRSNGGIPYPNFSQSYGGDVAAIMPRRDVPVEYATFNPNQLRSRFAAFDPARANEADLLGNADPRLLAILAGSAGIGGYLNNR